MAVEAASIEPARIETSIEVTKPAQSAEEDSKVAGVVSQQPKVEEIQTEVTEQVQTVAAQETVQASQVVETEAEKTETLSKFSSEYSRVSFTDSRGQAHNGYFYTKYDSEEDCRKDTDKFIKELHQELGREVVGGYTVVYNEVLQSYVAKFVGLDGLPIKDARILVPGYKLE